MNQNYLAYNIVKIDQTTSKSSGGLGKHADSSKKSSANADVKK